MKHPIYHLLRSVFTGISKYGSIKILPESTALFLCSLAISFTVCSTIFMSFGKNGVSISKKKQRLSDNNSLWISTNKTAIKDSIKKYNAYEALMRKNKHIVSKTIRMLQNDANEMFDYLEGNDNDIEIFNGFAIQIVMPNALELGNIGVETEMFPGQLFDEQLQEIPAFSSSVVMVDNSPKIVVTSDKQNVHDHYLNKSIDSCILKLQKSLAENGQDSCRDSSDKTSLLIAPENVIYGLKAEISNRLREKPELYILEAELNSIYDRRDIRLSRNGLSEMDALTLVWNRINQYRNPEHKSLTNSIDIAIENLLLNLVDGKGGCEVGKFNRIIDSLNVIDPLVNIKPFWSVRQEILDKAANLWQECANTGINISSLKEELIKYCKENCTEGLTPSENIRMIDDVTKDIDTWLTALM